MVQLVQHFEPPTVEVSASAERQVLLVQWLQHHLPLYAVTTEESNLKLLFFKFILSGIFHRGR